MSGSGGCPERSINIRVDPFQGCMCFVFLIMECGFCVLPQGTSFAYIMLLKCSFGEARVYFLHNLQGTMIQMAKCFVPNFTNIMAMTFSALVINATQYFTSSLYKFFTRTPICFAYPVAMCIRNTFPLLKITS